MKKYSLLLIMSIVLMSACKKSPEDVPTPASSSTKYNLITTWQGVESHSITVFNNAGVYTMTETINAFYHDTIPYPSASGIQECGLTPYITYNTHLSGDTLIMNEWVYPASGATLTVTNAKYLKVP